MALELFDVIGVLIRIIARNLYGAVRTAIRTANFQKIFFISTDLQNFEHL